jgi:hypothetical protein
MEKAGNFHIAGALPMSQIREQPPPVKGKIASHSGTVLRELFCRSESMAGMK